MWQKLVWGACLVTATIGADFLSAVAAANTRPVAGATRMREYRPADPNRIAARSEADRARIVMNDFAVCVIGKRRSEFEALMAEQRVPDTGSEKLRRLVERVNCIEGANLGFQAAPFVRAAHRAMLLSDYKVANDVPPLQRIDYRSLTDLETPEAAQWISLMSFGQCVALAAPQETVKLLYAREQSTDQADAFAAISPQLGPCLAEGQQISISRALLFGLLAEVTYRSAKGVPVTAPE